MDRRCQTDAIYIIPTLFQKTFDKLDRELIINEIAFNGRYMATSAINLKQ